MTTKPIIVKDGIGREKNPHKFYKIDWSQNWENGETEAYESSNDRFERFEQTIHKLFAFTPDGKVPADGSYEAEIGYQYQYDDGTWVTCYKMAYDAIENRNNQNDGMPKEPIRQIWLISDVVQGEQPEGEDNIENHFYLQTKVGPVHVNMNKNSSKETFDAVQKMVELAHDMPSNPHQPLYTEEEVKEIARSYARMLVGNSISFDEWWQSTNLNKGKQ